jgi:thiosulfate dehydrogenase [quinone] large subunit
LPFVLVGAARQPTLEPTLRRVIESRAHGSGPARDERRADGYRSEPWAGEPELTRRNVLTAALGMAAAATAAIAGLSVVARGTYRAPRTLGAALPRPKRGTSTTASGAAPADIAAPGATNRPQGAVKLGAASQLPAGQAATYPDPRDGSPDIVIHETDGTFVAHSAVCTHAGCTVGYQGGQIVCPCHGAVYDAQTGAVISGPAPAPLAPRKVIESGGDLYAIPA